MTKIAFKIGKPINYRIPSGFDRATVTDWCDDCFLDIHTYKCRIAIGRPDSVFIDDVELFIRPQECKDMEVKEPDEQRDSISNPKSVTE